MLAAMCTGQAKPSGPNFGKDSALLVPYCRYLLRSAIAAALRHSCVHLPVRICGDFCNLAAAVGAYEKLH